MAGIAAQRSTGEALIWTRRSEYHGDVFIINGGQSRFVRHAYMDPFKLFSNHMVLTDAVMCCIALLYRYESFRKSLLR
jgi:hypothetical protein